MDDSADPQVLFTAIPVFMVNFIALLSLSMNVLPFTSALAGLCAAASAAVVEVMPLVSAVPTQSLMAVFFPMGSSLFAAAASVSKARCEVDAQAASSAASRGLVTDDEMDNEADPNKMVVELLTTTAKTSAKLFKTRMTQFRNLLRSGMLLQKIGKKVARWLSKKIGVDWSVVGGKKKGMNGPKYAGSNI